MGRSGCSFRPIWVELMWLLCCQRSGLAVRGVYEFWRSTTYDLTDSKIPNHLPKSARIDSKGLLSVFLFWCIQVCLWMEVDWRVFLMKLNEIIRLRLFWHLSVGAPENGSTDSLLLIFCIIQGKLRYLLLIKGTLVPICYFGIFIWAL